VKLKYLRHFFLPHPETHKKAHLISPAGIFVYIALFIILQVSLTLINTVRPGILGVSANIDYKEVIRLTNQEREKKGLSSLRENANLNVAAYEKGKNMIEEQYWAHYSPSGKDPWGFILRAGYKYSYAGENLARNFSNANEAVVAWMNSPTHRDNILNSKYQDIGISVVHGNLNGEETTLIIQEFGTPISYTASNPTTPPRAQVATAPTASQQTALGESNQPITEIIPAEGNSPITTAPVINYSPPEVTLTSKPAVINPFELYRSIGLGMVAGLGFLLVVDLYVLKRRGVFRPASHHVAHLALLGVAGSALTSMSQGKIL
jgi:hypothetical protein